MSVQGASRSACARATFKGLPQALQLRILELLDDDSLEHARLVSKRSAKLPAPLHAKLPSLELALCITMSRILRLLLSDHC